MDLSSAPAVLADLQAGVLLRSLVIAAVLVTPYGLYKRRQVRSRRAEAHGPGPTGATTADAPVRPRLEDVVDELPAAAAAARAQGAVTVHVPRDATVDGHDAPPELLDALVRDGLRRSGLLAVAEVDTADGRTIECRPAPPAT